MIEYTVINVGFAKFLIFADNNELFGVHYYDEKEHKNLVRDFVHSPTLPLFANVQKQLQSYFSGKLDKFSIDYKFYGTEFQKKVWAELAKVPYGKTVNYKDVAIKIGKPKAVRAVGTAIGKNPILIIVPCHRVIRSNDKLGGFSAGLDLKRLLLSLETGKDIE